MTEVNNTNQYIGKFKKISFGGQELSLDPITNQINFTSNGDEGVFINTITKDSNINMPILTNL
jgi:hypothetical protein